MMASGAQAVSRPARPMSWMFCTGRGRGERDSDGLAIQSCARVADPSVDFVPENGWTPDPSWPPAPPDWQFWIDDGASAALQSAAEPPAVPHESWRERRAGRHVATEQAEQLAVWQAQQSVADELATAAGQVAKGGVELAGLLLKRGELGLWLTNAALVEPRIQQGHDSRTCSGAISRVTRGIAAAEPRSLGETVRS